MANYMVNISRYHEERMASFLVHTKVGINYLQFLNGSQMEVWLEVWALYMLYKQ